MSKLSVNLVVWNGAKYIPYLFESLRRQSFCDFKLYILDNGSADNTIDIIQQELNNFFVQYDLVENKDNFGFAGGQNLLFKKIESEYVLLLNQDVYLAPDCLEKLVGCLDSQQRAGSISPRLMKWDFSAIYNNLEYSFTNQIDSLGMIVGRNRRVVDWQGGKVWNKNDFLEQAGTLAVKVFGVSGALPMYRVSALRHVAYENKYFFDSLYGSYKEDVDLAYRLAAAGYESYVVLDAAAYHDRAGAGAEDERDMAAATNKQKQSAWVKYNSYKNHLMTLYKNEYGQNFLLDFPWILWYETKKFVYFLLYDRQVLGGLKEIWKNRRELAKNRSWIKKKRKLNWREMRRFWASKI